MDFTKHTNLQLHGILTKGNSSALKKTEYKPGTIGYQALEEVLRRLELPFETPKLPQAAPDLPAMNEDLLLILGKICFQCSPIARVLRLGGMEIKTRAENEQAHVIHWLLSHYLKDPAKWAENAGDEIKAIQEKVLPS